MRGSDKMPPVSNLDYRSTDDRQVKELARRLRGHVLRMTSAARSSHVGSSLSAADLIAVLYGSVLKVDPSRPQWPDRDRLIVSKGHAAAVVYAALAEVGFISLDELADYGRNGSRLFGHVTVGVPGAELSTGSLGHGLPVAVGMALAGKRDGQSWRAFVLMSDGECDEGSNWEAILFAGHHKLDNLVAVVDYNKIQSLASVEDTLSLEPLADKWRAFGWDAVEVDGHDISALNSVLIDRQRTPGRPTVVVAHTIKGRGVSFMEGKVAWHYRFAEGEDLERALAEVSAH
jgi:transketolase